MTTEKLVNKALFGKTQLSSKKIELGVVEDIAKIAADANSTLKVLIDDKTLLSNADKAIATAMSNADKVAANSQKNAQKALALLPKIGTILEKADKSARELGLDSKGITGYTELDKLYFTLEAAEKEVGLGYKFQN
jgi:hypothetical protein